MSIGGIGLTPIAGATLTRSLQTEAAEEMLSVEEIDETEESAEEEDEGAGRAKGVLRKLLEGHFKGVADIRLRINFHTEIAAIQERAVREVTEEKISEVQGSVDSTVESILASDDLSEEQATQVAEIHDSFSADVQGQVEVPPSSDSVDTPSPADALEISFHDFMAALTAALIPAPAEPAEIAVSDSPDSANESDAGVIPPEGPDASDAIPAHLQELLANLRAEFETSLAELREGIESARSLPELSEPRGNGKAYEKFLAIYSAMTGGVEASETSESEGLEATA